MDKVKIRFVIKPLDNGWVALYQEWEKHSYRTIEGASGATPEVALNQLKLRKAKLREANEGSDQPPQVLV